MTEAKLPSGVINFLTGGGEMGALMRAHDWTSTSLGPPEGWPQPLRTAIRLMLNTGHPMYVLWGPELLCFYNDAYSPSIGPERHPGSLSLPAREVWEEIWDVISPQIEQVMSGLGATWHENHLIPITRAGAHEEVYWTYSYSPIDDESAPSGVGGVLVVCAETTQTVLAERRAAEVQEHQGQMLRQMPGFVAMLSGPDLVYTYVNDAYVEISERTDFVGRRFRDVFADIEGQGYFKAFENAYRSGQGMVARGMELRLHGRDESQYIDFVLEPIRDKLGAVTGLFVGGYETTELYRSNKALRTSEARLAFFDRLGAETVPLADADAVLAATTRLLGEHLDLSVCAYADMDDDEDGFTIRGHWAAPGAKSIVGHYSLADFGRLAVENLSAGKPLVINDNLAELAPEEAATFQNIGIAATLCMPLVKEGRLTALMAIHDRKPRVWTDDELSLVRAVASRSWAHVERVAAVEALRDREERLRLAVDNAEVGFWDLDVVHDALIWPPRTKAMFGISPDVTVTLQDFYDGLHNDDREASIAAFTAASDPKLRAFYDVEYRTIGKEDGILRWIAAKGRGLFDGAGRCVRVAGTVIDITARKAAEAALRESETRFRGMADHAPVMVWVTDQNAWCTYLNRAWYEFTGQSAREAEGMGWLDATHPDDKADVERIFLDANARREAFRVEYRLRRADGTYNWIIDAASPRFGPDGDFLGYIGSVLDIDERRMVEERLRESEARFRLMADAVPQIVWITDRHGRMEFLNRQFVEFTGAHGEAWVPEEMAANFIPYEDGAQVVAAFATALELGKPFEIEHRIRSAAGEERWFLARAEPYRDSATGEITRWFGASVDIHDRKLAEEQLRELNASLGERVAERTAERNMLATLVETTDVMVMAADFEYNILAINAANADEFARVYGVRPKSGDNLLQLLAGQPEHQAEVKAGWDRGLGGGQATFIEDFGDPEHDRPFYEIKFWPLRNDAGEQIGAYQFVTDVSERLRREAELASAQEALRQSQKMEGMGQLTGGVAHDFNNLLTPIIGSLDMLVRRGVGSERERRLIDGALQSADRAKTLVQRLLAFARRQPLQSVSVDIGMLVKGMVGLIGSTLGPTIEVRIEVAPDLPPAKVDASQLEMALLNLAVNARDAMPDGGELIIKAKRADPSRQQASGLARGHYVLLCVVDNGVGMDEATRQRAIEPFFSTKGIGKGTGLGLSMAHGLAAQLGGGLVIESTPGSGTAIELWLPVSTAPIGKEETATATPGARVGRGVVLLVDDEELVRMSTADMLTDLGFDVVEAGSGEDALGLLTAGTKPNIIITDHLMPGMTGADLAREARAIQPALPILIVSGYAELDGLAPDLPRLAKPFRNAELAESISALLPLEAG